jgi:hypothetical protein
VRIRSTFSSKAAARAENSSARQGIALIGQRLLFGDQLGLDPLVFLFKRGGFGAFALDRGATEIGFEEEAVLIQRQERRGRVLGQDRRQQQQGCGYRPQEQSPTKRARLPRKARIRTWSRPSGRRSAPCRSPLSSPHG